MNIQADNPREGISRRTVLHGIGVTLALPLLQRDADAETTAPSRPPKRMLCVANPLGFVGDNFFPTSAGAFGELPRLLQPLAKMKDDFTVFSNLDHGVSGGHQSVHTFLSGIRDNESAQWESRNISMDQRAAELTLGQTRFPSIVASVGKNTDELECRTSWTRTGVNIPPITRTTALFDALFLAENAKQRQAKRKAFQENASILDVVFRQATSMEPKLGLVDREKLDEYLTSVRSVEKRLQMSDEWLDRPKPKVGMKQPKAGQAFTERLPLFYDLIRLAFVTDSTRVATLSIPGNLPVADLGLSGNYHAFSHHGKTQRMLDPLFQIEHFQMRQLARFLKSLQDTKQPDGGNLLDQTMVLAGSGMGNPSSHSNKNLPILLAGGGFQHGQHRVMPKEAHRRVPLGNLFTTMLQKFGDRDTDRFNRATGTLDFS